MGARAMIDCICCGRCGKWATATGGGICEACVVRETRDTEITALRAELAAAKNRALIAEKQDERSRHLVRLWKDDREAQSKALSAMTAERDQLAAHGERLEKALKPFADRIKQYPPWMWEAMVVREKQGIITGGFRVGGEAVTHMPAMLLADAEAAIATTPAQSLAAHDAAVKVAVLREAARLVDDCSGEALRAEADRIEKEAANGSALLRDAKQALSDAIKQADEILDRRGIPRSNAARSER